MDLELRALTPDDFGAYMRRLAAAFSFTATDEHTELERARFEPERGLGVFDGTDLVAAAGAFSLTVSVPGGGAVPAAGVTAVSVAPTHRRRGILRTLMRRQLDDVRERGEPLAMLWASESVIYGRFGYGLSASSMSFDVDRPHAGLARAVDVPGRLRLLEPDEARQVIPPIFDAHCHTRPGMVSRSQGWWDIYFRDFDHDRHGAGPRAHVVCESQPGSVDGYADYRVRSHWEANGLPNGRVFVGDVITATPAAYAALWQYLLDLDLIGTVTGVSRPLDEPLRYLLADPRRLRVTRLADTLWVRILDVPAALAARRYAADGALVLDVADPLVPEAEGRFEMRVDKGRATVKKSRRRADVAIDTAALAASYLGGTRFATLAGAGRVHGDVPAIMRADLMFGSDLAPWCTTDF